MKVKIIIGLLALSSLTAAAQVSSQQKEIILKSSEGVVTRGAADPNIKQGMKPNDANNPAPFVKKNRHAERGGAPPTELKASIGNAAVDANIKDDSALNNRQHPQNRPQR